MPYIINKPLELRQLSIAYKLDSDGEVELTTDHADIIWLDKEEAAELVAHLIDLYNLPPQVEPAE